MIQKGFKLNNFSRNAGNDARMGAFYTNAEHCERIGRLFKWPDEEVCCLEPAVGDGIAIDKVTQATPNKKIFAVELNKDTYTEIKDKYDYVLNADFLTGVKITNRVFSFCYSNPPYGVMENDGKMRYETAFLEKIYSYLKKDGILVYVIGYSTLKDINFLQKFMARFIPLATFRFDDEEYRHFRQIVVIGMKRNSIGYMRKWLDDYYTSIDELEKLPYLPKLTDTIHTLIPVLPSSADDIVYFTTQEFDVKSAQKLLSDSSLYKDVLSITQVPHYRATELGHPPIPLPKDLLYLVAVSGGGQGKVGSEETNDLHLQRGVVQTITEQHIVKGEKNESVLIETSYNKVSVNLIEQDGINHCSIRTME